MYTAIRRAILRPHHRFILLSTNSFTPSSNGGSEGGRTRSTPRYPLRMLIGIATALTLIAGSVVSLPTGAMASGSGVFPGGIFVPHTSSASQAAITAANSGNTSDAAVDRLLAAQPTAIWLGDWLSNSQLSSTVSTVLNQARSDGTTPVFVTYAIPDRDCGGYSAGGLTPSSYASWTQALANAVSGRRTVIIEEPDALAQLSSCPQDYSSRTSLLYNATQLFSGVGATVYLDAGNSNWVPAQTMLQRLWNSGLQFARGFSSNVSNFYPTSNEQSYDEQLRSQSGKNYVIDVSRNGRGSSGAWCNPPGAALGVAPRVVSDSTGLDALLWIKAPGESDGNCNGSPAAGAWFQSSADSLVANR